MRPFKKTKKHKKKQLKKNKDSVLIDSNKHTSLIHLRQEIQNQCIKNNAQVPDYDFEDNSLEGHITLSHKGVHLPPIYMFHDGVVYPVPKTGDPLLGTIRFDYGEYVTCLTQAIHPPVVGPMVLNVFEHTEEMEVGDFFDDSVPSISVKMSEYQGEPSDFTVQQIQTVKKLVTKLVTKLEKLHRFDGCQTLRSRLTVLTLW